MIRKAQIKFIAIIMSILMGFFILLSFITLLFLNDANIKNVDKSLNETIIQFENSDNINKTYSKTFIARISGSSVLVISTDENTFSEEEAINFTTQAISKPYSSGREGVIFYRIVNVKSSYYLFATDASETFASQKTSVVRICLVNLGVYGLLFVIVYLFSFSVFEPIKESFIKQRQFVSNASHELKTPLTIISANADVLKQTEPNQWVDNIKSQTERLEVLVTDMLEMAKIDETKPKINKEEFNLSDEIIKTALHFDALAFEKGKTLEIDILPDLIYNGDRTSVNKIVNILLDNAVKYASDGGIIKVSLYKKNGKTILSVFNTGSSVPSNQANKIFQRFYRFDNSRSRESGGSGLGLSIAKGLADSNKWKISAISKQDEYMIINVTF